MIHNIVFDLGNVLIHCDLDFTVRELARKSTLDEASIRRHLEARPTDHHAATLIDEFDEGRHTPEEFAALMREAIGWDGTTEELEAIWRQMLSPDRSMFDYLQSLIDSGLQTYILSNANPFHVDHVKETYPKILDTLGQIFSCDVKLIKPNEAIFQHTLDAFSIAPEETIFIDDREINVEAAIRVGFHGIVHRSLKSTRDQVERLLRLS